MVAKPLEIRPNPRHIKRMRPFKPIGDLKRYIHENAGMCAGGAALILLGGSYLVHERMSPEPDDFSFSPKLAFIPKPNLIPMGPGSEHFVAAVKAFPAAQPHIQVLNDREEEQVQGLQEPQTPDIIVTPSYVVGAYVNCTEPGARFERPTVCAEQGARLTIAPPRSAVTSSALTAATNDSVPTGVPVSLQSAPSQTPISSPVVTGSWGATIQRAKPESGIGCQVFDVC